MFDCNLSVGFFKKASLSDLNWSRESGPAVGSKGSEKNVCRNFQQLVVLQRGWGHVPEKKGYGVNGIGR